MSSPPDRRERLLTAAAQLFSTRPYDEVTTTEIAKRAGVAYGLLAHHFGSKRGLYVATVQTAADRLRALRDTPVEGDTPLAQLRFGLARQIAYLDDNQDVYLAIVHGNLGADPEVRATIEAIRWEAAALILDRFGAKHPHHPVLRAAMRGWIGAFNEVVVDRIEHHDVPVDDLVDLLIASLISTLTTAQRLAPDIELDLGSID